MTDCYTQKWIVGSLFEFVKLSTVKVVKSRSSFCKVHFSISALVCKMSTVHHFITTNPHHDAVFRLFTKIFTSIIIHVRTVLSLHCYTKQMKQKKYHCQNASSLSHTRTHYTYTKTLNTHSNTFNGKHKRKATRKQ